MSQWISRLFFVSILAVSTQVAFSKESNDDPGNVENNSSTGFSTDIPENGIYIVILDQDPAISYSGGIASLAATKPQADQKIDPQNVEVTQYVDYLKNAHSSVLANAGVDSNKIVYNYVYSLNGFAAYLTLEQVVTLASAPGVRMVVPDQIRKLTTDSSSEFLGLIDKAGRRADPALTGEDVVVGVIDTGIWPEHPSFADDGSYGPSPVGPIPCEFGNVAHNVHDDPFTCNNKLLGARVFLDARGPDAFDSARDADGHGSHTASTAAGNAGVPAEFSGHNLELTGIAPRARIIAYKAITGFGGFGSDLTAAIDQAVADGVDVINYSIGGGPSLTDSDDIAFLFAQNAGIFVATSAGNNGPGPSTIGGPGTVPWLTTVGASTQERFFEGRVKIFNESKDKFSGASSTEGTDGRYPLVDSVDAGSEYCYPGSLNPAVVSGAIVLCRRGIIARVAKSQAVLEAGGVGMIMYNNSDADDLNADSHSVPSVHIDYTPGQAIKEYIAAADSPEAKITGGTKKVGKWENAPTMTAFSSRGPNPSAHEILKPDITAPGMQILAATTPYLGSTEGNSGELFQLLQGTSMSSPHVAGVFALIKQYRPDWTPAMAKSAVMTTSYQSVRDNDRTSPAIPFSMGSGHLNPGRLHKNGSVFNPGLVYNTGNDDYLGFLCGARPYFPEPGECDYLESMGISFDPSELNLPSIAANIQGFKKITRTVTNVDDKKLKFVANVIEPEGFDVSVTPRRLRLEPGESKTYEITISGDGSVPESDWQNGSIIWKGKKISGGPYNHRAYSPIVVRGTQFYAPDSLSETGTSGSTSFDVRFGYTGDYSVVPVGFVGPTLTSDAIGQDPDKTYPSGDDGSGGVQKIPFPIANAKFARWELKIPGTDDLDLFLEDSLGNIIAQSINPETNEVIEINSPADDTYTMVVHGWEVSAPPMPYDLKSWIVTNVPSAMPVVDSAPATAVGGTVGTVDLSWTGLTPNSVYFGAIEHNDANGTMKETHFSVNTE